ncbi:MAG: glyoxylate/hydroxypyruvate reductase A [Emcibacteraceae bacterium]|nr:glyoxylate/hydroxypyruvate reductase A [Emcibacteraceae bacterium]MDG1995573.1 glyoxylate/hydroxypyruvate reductase A [Emcibacteraceae bacterium]
MAILILLNQVDPSLLETHLKSHPDCPEVRIYPDVGDKNDIDCVIVWKHDEGVLNEYPNLKLIASYGAGVENILSDPALPTGVSITRFVDDTLSDQMAEFVLAAILNARLHITYYREQQAAAQWRGKDFVKGRNVTILGLGELGSTTAKLLTTNGYTVSGWSRTQKHIDGVTSYYGDDQLNISVSKADFVVCLLPLTAATINILNKGLFTAMKKGAHLINVGRGDHLNEDDLMDALYSEHLSGALLDVFKVEPLPDDHPFWRHPKIHITPHISSPTDKGKVARQILDNYARMKHSEPLINQVDRQRSY